MMLASNFVERYEARTSHSTTCSKLPYVIRAGGGGNGTRTTESFNCTAFKRVWVLSCAPANNPKAHKEEPAVHQAGSLWLHSV